MHRICECILPCRLRRGWRRGCAILDGGGLTFSSMTIECSVDRCSRPVRVARRAGLRRGMEQHN